MYITFHYAKSCIYYICTYLEHVQYCYLLHRMDITRYYGLLLTVTMDLREVHRASTGYTDTHFAMQNIVVTTHVLTWRMQSVITYYIGWTSHITMDFF